MEEEFKFAGENDLLEERIQGLTTALQQAEWPQGKFNATWGASPPRTPPE